MLKWLFGGGSDSFGTKLGDNFILSEDGDLSMEVGDNLAIGLDDSSVSFTLGLDGEENP